MADDSCERKRNRFPGRSAQDVTRKAPPGYSCVMPDRARDINPETWKAVEDAVLCFIRNREDGTVLLMHKKTGLGAGLINAPGGRIEPGETPMDAAIRETKEEVGLDVSNLEHRGDLFFEFTDGHSIRGYVFSTVDWTGEPVETDEADPFWCRESEIPYGGMWADDSWWLPLMLQETPFRGRFVFDGEAMLSMALDAESGAESGISMKSGGKPQ